MSCFARLGAEMGTLKWYCIRCFPVQRLGRLKQTQTLHMYGRVANIRGEMGFSCVEFRRAIYSTQILRERFLQLKKGMCQLGFLGLRFHCQAHHRRGYLDCSGIIDFQTTMSRTRFYWVILLLRTRQLSSWGSFPPSRAEPEPPRSDWSAGGA